MPFLRPTNQQNAVPPVPSPQRNTAQGPEGQMLVAPALSAREPMAQDLGSRYRENAVRQPWAHIPETRTSTARSFAGQRSTAQELRYQGDNARPSGYMPYTPMAQGPAIQGLPPQPLAAQASAWQQPREELPMARPLETRKPPAQRSAFWEPRAQGFPAPTAGQQMADLGWEIPGAGYRQQDGGSIGAARSAWSGGSARSDETPKGQYQPGHPRGGHEPQHVQAPGVLPVVSPAEVPQPHPGRGEIARHERRQQERHQDRQARPEQAQPRGGRPRRRRQQVVEKPVNVPGPAGFSQLSVRLRSALYPPRSSRQSASDSRNLWPRQPQPPR